MGVVHEADRRTPDRRLGRIAIANADAGASAYLDTAIDEARPGVEELLA